MVIDHQDTRHSFFAGDRNWIIHALILPEILAPADCIMVAKVGKSCLDKNKVTAQALAHYGSHLPSRKDAGTGVAGGARE
jgi:hypothetical protein